MKAQSLRLLEDAKQRAYRQIESALRHLSKEGDAGSTFYWWDAEHQKHEDVAYYQSLYNFKLGDRGCGVDEPLFYNSSLHQWDTVMNMPVYDLCSCADDLIWQLAYRKFNKQPK